MAKTVKQKKRFFVMVQVSESTHLLLSKKAHQLGLDGSTALARKLFEDLVSLDLTLDEQRDADLIPKYELHRRTCALLEYVCSVYQVYQSEERAAYAEKTKSGNSQERRIAGD